MIFNAVFLIMAGGFLALWLWKFGRVVFGTEDGSAWRAKAFSSVQEEGGNAKAGEEVGNAKASRSAGEEVGNARALLAPPQDGRLCIKGMAKVFALAFFFRLLVYGAGAALYCMNLEGTSFSFQDFLSVWNRWDGPHYLDLAKYGYEGCLEDGQHLFLVFFPLYPWTIRLFQLLCRDWQLAGLVVSTLAYALGAAFFHEAVASEYDGETAEKSLALLSVSPFAFYFGAIMTESLFFCLLSMAFYFIRRRRWVLAGFVGALCALCRAQGILILGVGAVEFLTAYPIGKHYREKRMKDFWMAVLTKGAFLLISLFGLFLYFWINDSVEGDPLRFVFYQKDHWHLAPTFFTNALREICSYLFSPATDLVMKVCVWLPEFLAFLLAFVALYYGLNRHPLKYTAFLFVYVMLNYSVTWLVSGARYMLCALPLYMILGEFARRHPKCYPWILTVSAMLMTIYMGGFFAWKPVM